MYITLATHSFAQPGGSETYVLTVAEQLQRLGHGVTVLTARTGPMSEFAIERGVPVLTSLDGLDGRCDAAIVQDSIQAYRLAERYPHAPKLFRAASELHDLQLPPALPHLVGAVVACSDRVQRRMRALATQHPIHRLRQPVDTERFMPARDPIATPRQAVLLGNHLRGGRLEMMRSALERRGIACVQVGAHGELTCTPEHAIWDADIVVAKGRAALEGMACGRAVFIYDHFGGDGWITPERYDAMEADNFAGLSGPQIANAAQLEEELSRYSPEMGTVNRELAVRYHGARAHTNELCSLLAAIEPPVDRTVDPLAELSRLVRVQWLAEVRALAFEDASRRAHQDAERLRAELERAQGADRDLVGDLRRQCEQLGAENRELKTELERLRSLGRTRRVQLALQLGRIADTARRRTGR